MEALNQFLDIAISAAHQAGTYIVAEQRKELTLYAKGYRDWATHADLESQRIIIDTITQYLPQHQILAEEGALARAWRDAPEQPPVWIIDPIDGTSNYSRRISNYAISIAMAHHGEVQLGIVYDPVHDELFTALRGQGSYLNGKLLSTVASVASLDQAIVSFDWGRSKAQRQQVMDTLDKLVHSVRTMRALGSAALALCWIADQRLDAYFNFNMKLWDIAAAGLILSEAEGVTCGPEHSVWRMDAPMSWSYSTSREIYETFLACVEPAGTNLIQPVTLE